MHPDIKPGKLFPDIHLPDQEGNPFHLSTFMAGRPTIVVFVRGYY